MMMSKQERAAAVQKIYTEWTDGPKYLLIQFDDPAVMVRPLVEIASAMGSNEDLVQWVTEFIGSIGTVYVACYDDDLYNVQNARPDLDIRSAYRSKEEV